jgi:nicotinate-nucleotide adenylyltransferase
MAVELKEKLQLEKVHLVPCYEPVHRDKPCATPEDRMAMVESAIEEGTGLIADPREINRQGPSYFIDTLNSLIKDYPHTPLCLLLGIDAFLGFKTWRNWKEILDHMHLIIAHRPQFQLPRSGEIADLVSTHLQRDISYITNQRAGGIILKEITALEISASDIRKQFAMGHDPRYLLPNNVYNYIKQRQIYR